MKTENETNSTEQPELNKKDPKRPSLHGEHMAFSGPDDGNTRSGPDDGNTEAAFNATAV